MKALFMALLGILPEGAERPVMRFSRAYFSRALFLYVPGAFALWPASWCHAQNWLHGSTRAWDDCA